MAIRTISAEGELLVSVLEQLEAANQSAAAATGACLISTPGNPRPTCAMLTAQQCSAIGGTYVGGACPSFEATEAKATEAEIMTEGAGTTVHVAAVTCTYGGKSYSEGARICSGGRTHECTKSGWVNLGFKC